MAIAVPIIAGISAIIGAFMQYEGMKKNKEQFDKSFGRNEYWQGVDVGEGKKVTAANIALSKSQLGLQKEQFKFDKEQTEKKWKWESDDRNWQRGWDVTNNFKSLLLTQPTYKTMLQNIWRRQ